MYTRTCTCMYMYTCNIEFTNVYNYILASMNPPKSPAGSDVDASVTTSTHGKLKHSMTGWVYALPLLCICLILCIIYTVYQINLFQSSKIIIVIHLMLPLLEKRWMKKMKRRWGYWVEALCLD